jgi:hypothetical protein
MTTTNETETTKAKRPADFYIFLNGPKGQESKIAGRAYVHKKGKGFTILIDGKAYAAFPAKAKAAQAEATEGKGA